MSILLQNPFQHFPIPCPRPATRTAQNSLPRSTLTSDIFGNGKLREIMGGCGKIKGSGRIRIPDLNLETFLRRPHEMKQDLERFRPDGPPRTYTIRAGPEIKNPCKTFARALKEDCGFIFFSRHGRRRRRGGMDNWNASQIPPWRGLRFPRDLRGFCPPPLPKRDVFQSGSLLPYIPTPGEYKAE